MTGLIAASGNQGRDWSADYRLFERARINMEDTFKPIRMYVISQLDEEQPLSVAMDDTRIRKRGRKIFGTSWTRDPLGPPFQTNIIWGQRFLQISSILPESNFGPSMARAVPIGFQHAPVPPKPKKKAPKEEWDQWKIDKKNHRLPVIGAKKIQKLRRQLDANDQKKRHLIVNVDGAFTNATMIKNLPRNTTLIGRLRKDAKLFRIPDMSNGGQRGRKRFYGEDLPTPEQIRQDKDVPWIPVKAFAAGKIHDFDVKIIDCLRWRGAGDKNLKLIIVRPLAYRLTKNSRLLYRDPGYLICTNPDLSPEIILQNYLWRWEIELNFRDEKTLLGVGEAQARLKTSATLLPAFMVAAYSYLLLATHKIYGFKEPKGLLKPKWQAKSRERRITTQKMLGCLRMNLWGKGFGIDNLSDFLYSSASVTKSFKFSNPLISAVYFASK